MTKTTLAWDCGTAYELFISLHVLHVPDMFGIRASWAAGIRSRMPAIERKFLEDVMPFLGIPLAWIHSLPDPKDALSVLWTLRQLPAAQRVITVMDCEDRDKPYFKTLLKIAKNGVYTDQDVDALFDLINKGMKGRSRAELTRFLDWFSRPEEFGERLLTALQAYYQSFFEEEEKRVSPVLKAALANAQQLATHMPPTELFVELSQGVHLEEDMEEVILVPAFWTTPLILYEPLNEKRLLMAFGARPVNMAAIPGEMVPDGLVRTLKAMADPTRLKILHYLAKEELTPSELARRLHLRAPTVTHHLSELRLAGLVHLIIKGQEKKYTARREALKAMCSEIEAFLDRSE